MFFRNIFSSFIWFTVSWFYPYIRSAGEGLSPTVSSVFTGLSILCHLDWPQHDIIFNYILSGSRGFLMRMAHINWNPMIKIVEFQLFINFVTLFVPKAHNALIYKGRFLWAIKDRCQSKRCFRSAVTPRRMPFQVPNMCRQRRRWWFLPWRKALQRR